ncbi:DUF2304 domain-containing protein [Atopobiaceae bacterium HCP3S3_A4]
MSAALRVFLLAIAIVFLIEVFRLVSAGKLQLKYSLLWMLLSLILIICAIFPGIVSAFSGLLGFQAPSNFVFLVSVVGLLGICLSLTVIVSWQARDIRQLIQRVTLMQQDLDKLMKDSDADSADGTTPRS